MSFEPDNVQLEILRCLEKLEVEGCQTTTARGKPSITTITMAGGVPRTLLSVWVGETASALDGAARPLIRRNLVRSRRCEKWPLPGGKLRLLKPNGRVVVLTWKKATAYEFFVPFAESIGLPVITKHVANRRGKRKNSSSKRHP